MPLFDLLGGTLNSKSWELQKEIYQGTQLIDNHPRTPTLINFILAQ